MTHPGLNHTRGYKPQCCSSWGYTHPRWLSHHNETHTRWFTTFKYCGCASHGWVLPHYHCSCWPSYWGYLKTGVFPKEQSTVCCCGWGYRPIKNGPPISHHSKTHVRLRCFITFKCCGCAHGWVLTMLPLPFLLAKLLKLQPEGLDKSWRANHSVLWWLTLYSSKISLPS